MYWFCCGHNLWQEIPAQEQAAGVHNNLGIVIFLFWFVRLKDRSGLLGYKLFSLVVGVCVGLSRRMTLRSSEPPA